MEGFGYQYFDGENSFDTSSPPTYTSEPSGFEVGPSRNKKQTGRGKDLYDFDVSHDGESPQKPARTRSVRRMSTDDRINEILEKSKLSKPSTVPQEENVEEDTYNSWKNSWNQLMEGVGGSPNPTALEDNPESASPVVTARNRKPQERKSLNASDSLDISDTDFEASGLLSIM